jgi:hypothetical protein
MRTLIITAVSSLLFLNSAFATPPDPLDRSIADREDVVLEQFKISLDDGAIMLPVEIDGALHRFMLDSGATVSVFDPSFVTGSRLIRRARLEGTGSELKTYRPPESHLGKIRLDHLAPEVVGFDMTAFNEVAGYKVAGVVGYDFIKCQIVQIDFDEGQLRILKTIPMNCGERVDIDHRDPKGPFVKMTVAKDHIEGFLIDTGSIGFASGSLRGDLCDSLLVESKGKVIGQALIETASGSRTNRLLQTDQLLLEKFSTKQAVFDQGTRNKLSLHYLSRYRVTFDFANHCIYLKKGKRFDQEDKIDRSGLHFLRRNGQTIVHSVDADSSAAKAGIRSEDVILRLAEIAGDSGSLHVMRRTLCQPASDVPMKIFRDGKELDIVLHLAHATVETSK